MLFFPYHDVIQSNLEMGWIVGLCTSRIIFVKDFDDRRLHTNGNSNLGYFLDDRLPPKNMQCVFPILDFATLTGLRKHNHYFSLTPCSSICRAFHYYPIALKEDENGECYKPDSSTNFSHQLAVVAFYFFLVRFLSFKS